MPRAVIIKVTCDPCAKRGVESLAEDDKEDELGLNRRRVVLDLCADCRNALDAALEPFLSAGRRATDDSSKPGPKPTRTSVDGGVECPHPECSKVLSNRDRMLAHFRENHGMTFAEWQNDQGLLEKSYPCDEPGCGRVFALPQGLGRHRGAAHPKARKSAARAKASA